jgi:prepilin-type processing-associated H-X9-DG protein
LLVVISIIALLVSLLLPALSKARESAGVTQCQTVVKQIGVGLMLYEEDFGIFPTGPFGRNNNSHGWAVNMTAVGDPNNTYWGTPNCNNGTNVAWTEVVEPHGYYVNPYCNLPAKIDPGSGNNTTEMFEMFHCPGDTGRIDNPFMPGCVFPASWPANAVTKFEWQGTSYEWNGMVQNYQPAAFRFPLDFQNGRSDFAHYWTQGLFWRAAHEVFDPSITVLAGDPPMFPNWEELVIRGWAGCHDYGWNNHGKDTNPFMNFGFLDGHVKYDNPRSYEADQEHFSNDEYTYMINPWTP